MINGKRIGIAISSYIENDKQLCLLTKCINTLIKTSSGCDEIVITDDCSTCQNAHKYYDTLPNSIKVITNHKNRGIAAMKNLGLLAIGKCDVCFLADCDIEFADGWSEFYSSNLLKSGIGTVSRSNIFGGDPSSGRIVVNGVAINKHTRFQGVFIAIDSNVLKKVGGFPILSQRYGQEHYNWQVRASRVIGSPGYVLDFDGAEKYICAVDSAVSSFSDQAKKMYSDLNSIESNKILRSGINLLPIHIGDKLGDNICVTIGHRESTPDRYDNTIKVVNYYKSILPLAEVVVVEQDESKRLDKSLRGDVKYVFAYNKNSYNRGWAYNISAKMTSKDVIMCVDNDVILKQHTVLHACVEKIMSNEFQFYKPYWMFLDLTPQLSCEFKKGFRFTWNDKSLQSRCGKLSWMTGGCVVANTKSYLKIGGFNEDFRGWGGEDDEMILRARRTVKTGRVVNGDSYDFNLYHLFHNRTIDCTNKQPKYNTNLSIFKTAEAMSDADFVKYTASIASKNFGCLNKYENEK